MNKSVIITAPITLSGYGKKSIDIIESIIKCKGEEWNVKIIPLKWGNTPKIEFPEFIKSRIIPKIESQPDLYFHIGLSTEFHPVGKWNCLITSGIETTLCSPEWIEGLNKSNLVIVPSKFTLDVFNNSKYIKNDKSKLEFNPNIKTEILFEGLDENLFNKIESNFDLNFIKEEFCFLTVGHWIGLPEVETGEDRKNISGLIKTFYNTFKNITNPPGLILKTSGGSISPVDRYEIQNKINEIKSNFKNTDKLPNIYLIHGELTDSEMNNLYNHEKIKSMVLLTHGEGFGRPLLEFSFVGKPIITTDFSGHLDFLDKNKSTLINGLLTNIHPSAVNKFLIKESKWYKYSELEANNILMDNFKNYKNYKLGAIELMIKNRKLYNKLEMTNKLNNILNKHTPKFSNLINIE